MAKTKKTKKKRKANPMFVKASKHCRATTEPFSKEFGTCMREQFGKAPSKKK